MVDVIMRVSNRVDQAHLGAEQLNPHLGRGVDDQVAGGKLQEHARTGTMIARVVGLANLAVAAKDRHPR